MKYSTVKRVSYSVSIFNNVGKSQNNYSELKKSGKPIIQNEVSQKDKEHYNILTHTYGI